MDERRERWGWEGEKKKVLERKSRKKKNRLEGIEGEREQDGEAQRQTERRRVGVSE